MDAVLVTGGAGFIGSHVVDAIIASGRPVRVLDVLHRAAHRERPGYLNSDAEYEFGDLGDGDLVRRCLLGVGAVSHQAAMVGLGTDFGDVRDYVRDNDAGTASLLWALHQERFEGPLVLGSSMVVYGEGRYACAEHGVVRPGPRSEAMLRAGRFEPVCPRCEASLAPRAVGEDDPVDPRNVYAATKLHQEDLARAWSRSAGTPLVALRYHNVYGPRMPRDTPYAGVASIFRSALESGRAPQVFEDGRQLRDFVHVADVARANVLALGHGESGTYNVASGTPRTVGDLAEALSTAMGAKAPRPLVTGAYRLGDVRHVFASNVRAADRLGFTAEVEFTAGVTDFAHAPLR